MNATMQKDAKSVRPQSSDLDRPFVSPNVNIVESEAAYILEAEMPGVAKEGLEINLEDNVLTILGRRQPDLAANSLYRESSPADYRRVFELDPSIETGKISAQIEQGVLTLSLPKAEKVKPRRIAVS